jgi:hypothetical protein
VTLLRAPLGRPGFPFLKGRPRVLEAFLRDGLVMTLTLKTAQVRCIYIRCS